MDVQPRPESAARARGRDWPSGVTEPPRNDLIRDARAPDGVPILRLSVGQQRPVPDPEQPPQPPWIGGLASRRLHLLPNANPRGPLQPRGFSFACRRSQAFGEPAPSTRPPLAACTSTT